MRWILVAYTEPCARGIQIFAQHQTSCFPQAQVLFSKCNLVKTDDDKDKVYGVVYDFLDADKPTLDKHEGLGKGYNLEEIMVTTDNGETRAYTYVADESAVDNSLKPYSWYKDMVVAGATQHSLPSDYILQLEAVKTYHDPDAEREKLNRQLLGC